MAPKSYREWSPFQSYLLPPSPTDWLPEDDLAFFVLDVVDQLDLSEVEAAIQAKDSRGNRPHDPRMMTALLVYGYCVGVRSSRKIEQATYRNVAFRVIAGDNIGVRISTWSWSWRWSWSSISTSTWTSSST